MTTTSRRDFFRTTTAVTGALVIGFTLPVGGGRFARAAEPAPAKPPVPPNAFLRIDKDGTCTVMIKHLEFGQGVTTSLAMLVAEELECDWTKVRAELAPAGPEYAHTMFGMQMTGGSSSVWNSYDQLRTVGAQARTMLMQAAASQWKVKPADVRAEKGFILGPGGKKLSYGQLAEAAGKLPVPEKVALKQDGFKLIGKATRRIDSADKVSGKTQFGMDVQRKNLHVALVAHAPVFGASVKTFTVGKVKSVPGVTHVIETRRGVAVVGKHFWGAKTGRDALEVEWDLGPNATVSSEALVQQFRDKAKTPGTLARKPENPEAMKGAVKTIVAEYEFPFLAHAAMEPLNCTVDFNGERAELWVGSQFQGVDLMAAAKALGLEPAKVKLNTMYAGGGFGRRANPVSDYIIEACQIAREVKVPVKVIWTREDDMRGGFYRPMYVHRVEVGLDARNQMVAWNHSMVGTSILAGTAFEPMLVKDGIDPTSTEGVSDSPYEIPNMSVNLHSVKTGVPVLWWRSVGHSHTAFVMETLMDELAAAAGKDPVVFRRELLAKHPRMVGVLNLAAEKAGWGSALPKGRARGIAVHESFGSRCAQVAEVSLEGGAVKVHRIVAAFDCGLVVNPMGVEAQLQSAIVYGLSAALMGKITLKDGQVQQSNFHDYPVLRMNEMPRIEVHLLPVGDRPSGAGEPGVPPTAPAIANALFALTGKPVRSLPMADLKFT